MIYKLDNNELQQIARVYEMDISALAEKLETEDDVIEISPFQKGLKIVTESGQSLSLYFKDNALRL